MGVYDQASRFAEHEAPAVLQRRVQLATTLAFQVRGWESPRTLIQPHAVGRDEDRTADQVAILFTPATQQWWLLLLEYQAQPDPAKLDVVLLEAARLRLHARRPTGPYQVLTSLVYLIGRCPEPVRDMTTPGGYGIVHRPLVWNVADDDAAATLAVVRAEPDFWGLLYWVPLMQGAEQPEMVADWRAVLESLPLTPTQRGNLQGIALVFAELAGCFLVWERGLQELDMTESAIVNRWMSQGESRGQLKNQRQNLLAVLRSKFGAQLTPDLERLVQQQDDYALLQTWFYSALDAGTYDQFFATLK
jgi:hypothetical protein